MELLGSNSTSNSASTNPSQDTPKNELKNPFSSTSNLANLSSYVPPSGFTLPNYLGTCPPNYQFPASGLANLAPGLTNLNPGLVNLNPGLANMTSGLANMSSSGLAGLNLPTMNFNPSTFTVPNSPYLPPNTNLLAMYTKLAQNNAPPEAVNTPTYSVPNSGAFITPPPVEVDEMMKKKAMATGRRNSIPFSFISGGGGVGISETEKPAPIVSGSFSAGQANNWLEMARMRHTHSLANSLSVGVSATVGRRAKMEDEFLVVPFEEGKKGEDVIGINMPTIPVGSNKGDLPLPSSLNRKRSRPSMSGFGDLNPAKQAKSTENSTPGAASSPEKKPAAAPAPPPAEKKKPSYAFFAVYDGHGGTACAEYVRMNLHSNIANHAEFGTNVEKAICEGFAKTEAEFASEGGPPGCGTTACVALIYESMLYIANVGDSDAVVCRNGKPIPLTNPHTLKSESEKARIEAVGGITVDGRLAHPQWNPKLINIAVTRAIGDMYFKDEQYTGGKPSGLISEPEIRKFQLTSDDRFILLGTDGFWDQISHQDAVDFVLQEKGLKARLVCKKLTDLVAKKGGEDDNATVLLVKLKGDDDEMPELAPQPAKEPQQLPPGTPITAEASEVGSPAQESLPSEIKNGTSSTSQSKDFSPMTVKLDGTHA